MGTQTLHLYEPRGLLEPARTEGGTRRYSGRDLARLRRIGQLLKQGLNLAEVALVLDLESHNADLKSDNAQLRADNARLGDENEEHQWRGSPRPGSG